MKVGKPAEPRPAKLFASLIASEDGLLDRCLEDLLVDFGEVDYVSERFPFDFTDYYAAEMGKKLFRRFVTFKDLISIPRLPEIKRSTNLLEERYSTPAGERRVNIDPGYVCPEHVVLGTTKAYSHRPYLRDGIYADLTLIYRKRSFQPLEWTYPDYRQGEVLRLFNSIRGSYLKNLRAKGQSC